MSELPQTTGLDAGTAVCQVERAAGRMTAAFAKMCRGNAAVSAWHRVTQLAAVTILAASPMFAYPAWQAPLSSIEESRAIDVAVGNAASSTPDVNKSAAPAVAPRSLTTATVTATTTAIDTGISSADTLGREVLLVELKRQKKSTRSGALLTPRIAEVFVFDYSSLKAELHRINVDSNELIETLPLDSIHLPLNDREQTTAKSLLSGHVTAMQELASEFESSFNRPLNTGIDLDMKLSIWKPSTQQVANHPVATACMTERCALVSIFTTDRYSFSLEPVINLVRGSVHLGVIR